LVSHPRVRGEWSTDRLPARSSNVASTRARGMVNDLRQ